MSIYVPTVDPKDLTISNITVISLDQEQYHILLQEELNPPNPRRTAFYLLLN